MGQYYRVINLDKGEYLNPYVFGDGAKLLEQGASGMGTMMGLAILLANSNNRGGGDLRSDDTIIGSWAGDRIVIAGDYAEIGDPAEDKNPILYNRCGGKYKDISDDVLNALLDDSYNLDHFKKASNFYIEERPKEYPKSHKALFKS